MTGALRTGAMHVLPRAVMHVLNAATKPRRPGQRARALMKLVMPSRAAPPPLVRAQPRVPKGAATASAARVPTDELSGQHLLAEAAEGRWRERRA